MVGDIELRGLLPPSTRLATGAAVLLRDDAEVGQLVVEEHPVHGQARAPRPFDRRRHRGDVAGAVGGGHVRRRRHFSPGGGREPGRSARRRCRPTALADRPLGEISARARGEIGGIDQPRDRNAHEIGIGEIKRRGRHKARRIELADQVPGDGLSLPERRSCRTARAASGSHRPSPRPTKAGPCRRSGSRGRSRRPAAAPWPRRRRDRPPPSSTDCARRRRTVATSASAAAPRVEIIRPRARRSARTSAASSGCGSPVPTAFGLPSAPKKIAAPALSPIRPRCWQHRVATARAQGRSRRGRGGSPARTDRDQGSRPWRPWASAISRMLPGTPTLFRPVSPRGWSSGFRRGRRTSAGRPPSERLRGRR